MRRGLALLIDSRVAANFLELLAGEIATLKIGDPLGGRPEYGPLISAAHRERVHSFVAEAVANGAKILAGGKIPPNPRMDFTTRQRCSTASMRPRAPSPRKSSDRC